MKDARLSPCCAAVRLDISRFHIKHHADLAREHMLCVVNLLDANGQWARAEFLRGMAGDWFNKSSENYTDPHLALLYSRWRLEQGLEKEREKS